ncbi:MAG: sigma 54-interacting transcriptional regulator [Acidobacteriota bacterium]|nr:sigma 54-interacting transcriptional regulator [Acidobacteriota bacterium]
MASRLVTIVGSLDGDSFLLSGEDFFIGRHGDNQLCIRHPSVSRQHCVVRRDGDGFSLEDLESRHGTVVNDKPIQKHHLVHGDVVKVGDAQLRFQDREEETSQTAVDFLSEPTASVALSAAMFLDSVRIEDQLQDHLEVGHTLNALLRISRALGEESDPEKLIDLILQEVLTALPADRTALVLDEEEEIFHAHRDGGDSAFHVSQTLHQRVTTDQVSLLCNDMVDTTEGLDSASLSMNKIPALIVAPLSVPRRRLGIIYADAVDGKALTEYHLELLTAVAAIGAAPLAGALRLRRLERENRYLREHALQHDMVGSSPAMQAVYDLIAKVAPTPSTLLIRGESGTGKELAARALHANSARVKGPFVALNCALLSEELLAGELFGHERGAFTGAVTTKVGKIEVARGGTLFLDEVGELPPPLQARLLRVLQEREFERVGGTRPMKADVRVVAATNRDLEEGMRNGSFREDLYYRLNVITLVMPPLRDRRGDIIPLARAFAARHAKTIGRPVPELTGKARACLLAYDWPGNVRELSNAVERAVVLGEDAQIRPEDLPETLHAPDPSSMVSEEGDTTYAAAMDALKRKLVLESVKKSGGNITRAAGLLDLHPNYLHRLIKNLGLRDQLS